MILIAMIIAMIAPGNQCDIVAHNWTPDLRGSYVTRGCSDIELGA